MKFAVLVVFEAENRRDFNQQLDFLTLRDYDIQWNYEVKE